MDFDAYLDRLASDAPVPGGGSAAAIVASLGAALVAMVGRLTARSSKFADFESAAGAIVERACALRAALEAARERDERAFAAVVRAQALPKSGDAERRQRTASLQLALTEAADAPLRCAALSRDVVQLAHEIAAAGNTGLASDVGSAAAFGAAAVAACSYNVRVNHLFLRDENTIRRQADALREIETEATRVAASVRELVEAALVRSA